MDALRTSMPYAPQKVESSWDEPGVVSQAFNKLCQAWNSLPSFGRFLKSSETTAKPQDMSLVPVKKFIASETVSSSEIAVKAETSGEVAKLSTQPSMAKRLAFPGRKAVADFFVEVGLNAGFNALSGYNTTGATLSRGAAFQGVEPKEAMKNSFQSAKIQLVLSGLTGGITGAINGVKTAIANVPASLKIAREGGDMELVNPTVRKTLNQLGESIKDILMGRQVKAMERGITAGQ